MKIICVFLNVDISCDVSSKAMFYGYGAAPGRFFAGFGQVASYDCSLCPHVVGRMGSRFEFCRDPSRLYPGPSKNLYCFSNLTGQRWLWIGYNDLNSISKNQIRYINLNVTSLFH